MVSRSYTVINHSDLHLKCIKIPRFFLLPPPIKKKKLNELFLKTFRVLFIWFYLSGLISQAWQISDL